MTTRRFVCTLAFFIATSGCHPTGSSDEKSDDRFSVAQQALTNASTAARRRMHEKALSSIRLAIVAFNALRAPDSAAWVNEARRISIPEERALGRYDLVKRTLTNMAAAGEYVERDSSIPSTFFRISVSDRDLMVHQLAVLNVEQRYVSDPHDPVRPVLLAVEDAKDRRFADARRELHRARKSPYAQNHVQEINHYGGLIDFISGRRAAAIAELYAVILVPGTARPEPGLNYMEVEAARFLGTLPRAGSEA